jgi:hypothetical protein
LCEYFENLFSSKLQSHEEIAKILNTYDPPKLNQEDINNFNSSMISNDTETVIKSLPTNKTPDPDRFTLNITRHLKNNTKVPQTIPKKYKGKEY